MQRLPDPPSPLIVAVALCGVLSVPSWGQKLALTNARLVDVENESIEPGVLILEDGRIRTRLDALDGEFDGEVLDVANRFVLPGFFDLHVHAFGNSGPVPEMVEFMGIAGTAERMAAAGVTGFLDLSNFQDDALFQRDRQRADPSHLPGAMFFTAGAAFTVPGGHGTQFPNPANVVHSTEQAVELAKRLLDQQPDVVKVIYTPPLDLPTLSLEAVQAIVTLADAHDVPVVAHCNSWEGALEMIEAGVSAITHTSVAPVPDPVIAAMLENGVTLIPTLAVHLDLSHFHGSREAMSWPLLERVSLPEFRATYLEGELPLRLQRWRERQVVRRAGTLESVRSLHEAGVSIATGSDAGNPGTFQGASLHRELRLLVEAGLSQWAALRAATVDAGRLLGLDVGLEPGDLGNLVVLDRSPVESIENSDSVAAVVIDGQLVDFETFDLPGAAPSLGVPRVPDEVVTARLGAVLASGTVAAPSGYRLSHVEVGLRAAGQSVSLTTTKTDSDGYFELRRSSTSGQPSESEDSLLAEVGDRLELVAVYPGFDPAVVPLRRSDLPAQRDIELSVSRFQEAIVVEAVSPTDQSLQPTQEFGFLDIVTTAGANADPLFATQTLPGVIKLDEGSGLFVRGGDSSEVATYLDSNLLDHPYRNETPTGGFFGTVDAFELEGLSLSAGGFSARYGDSLSAVLELRTRAPSTARALQFTVGLAAVAGSLETALGERASLRVAANRRDASALVEFNDAQLDFSEAPKGTDLSARFQLRASDRQTLTLSGYHQTSAVGTEIEDGNFVGQLDTGDDDRLLLADWQRTLGIPGADNAITANSASLIASASLGEHETDLVAGILELATGEETWRVRSDVDALVGLWRVHAGAVAAETRVESEGTLPEVSGDLGGDRGRRLWFLSATRRHQGAHVELERALSSRWAFNAGVRWDRWSRPDGDSIDPRVSVSFAASRDSVFRLAWGSYHQAPVAEYLTQGIATNELEIASAEHRVLSWQFRDAGDPLQLRIEAYEKLYEDLPLAGAGGYNSEGDGFARGVDLLLDFRTLDTSPSLRSGWSGFFAYTYLDAMRRYSPWQDNGRFETPSDRFAPDFAIPHTAQLVLRKSLPRAVEASMGFRFATGRPFTPVIGAVPRESEFGDYFEPIYGEINSDRLPDYQRVDLSLSKTFTVGASSSAIAFLGINDLFDRANVFRYVYSADWSVRRPARTAFGRTIYFGVSLRR